MGVYIGRGFDFFNAREEIPVYRLKLEDINPDFNAVIISIANRKDKISDYRIKKGDTIYVKLCSDPQLRICFKNVQLDRIGKPMANFGFYGDRVYHWKLV
ncbi:hypothetical protein EXS72_01465 [Candidatus Pacearchaeota archaeon]|nr:hypothetical protein [Candidatus Pacearchaeota archaeon]